MNFVRSLALGVLLLQAAPTTTVDVDTVARLYSQFGTLYGNVVLLNNPELGRTPASGTGFLLQRADCAKCLIGVRTDADGKYQVSLGAGTYRIYCLGGSDQSPVDIYRSGQPRDITVKPGPWTNFDFELEIPKSQ